MKQPIQRAISFVLVLVMTLCLLPAVTLSATAATVDYQYASTDAYSNIIKNWGTRGETATFLSPNAQDFYTQTSYETLSGYSGAESPAGSELYEALYTLMSDAHTTTNSYDESKYLFAYTDCQSNGSVDSGQISTFYSGTLVGPDWDSGSTFNREHTWPDSLGGSADTSASTRNNETDIMMLRPVTPTENSSRSNTPYGQSSGYYYPNKGDYDVRGDVARTILYVYVRLGNEQSEVLANLWSVFESKEVLLTWIEEDPVDTWELGRNDSVQSITGTRNVFVDYPELAFTLFNEQIPDMSTPSGIANATQFTLTAVSGNDAHGTVSVNANSITAFPAEGYHASGYEFVSGEGTVVRAGNVFTVTATQDCTVRILFSATAQYTARFLQDTATVATQAVYSGSNVTMPAFSGELPEGYTFLGWVTQTYEQATARPADIYIAGTAYAMYADTTFYALLSWVDETQQGESLTYQLVTDQAQLQAGESVIIAAAGYDKAMSTTQNGNNRGAVDVTKNGNTLVFDSSVQLLELTAGTVEGSFAFYTGDGYLYAVNDSSNYLRTGTSLSNGASFNITVNTDGSASVTSATYTASAGAVPIQYNNSSTIFSCYPKATQNALALYIGVSSGAVCYTTHWGEGCAHTEQTVIPGTAATLTQTGLTDGAQCAACGEVLQEQQIIPCLAEVDSWGLVLADDLCVKFKIYVDASIAATAQVQLRVVNSVKTYAVSQLTAAGDDFYYASATVAAPQMGESILVSVINGAEQTQEKAYSVLTYAQAILADENQSQYHALVGEMLNYGAAAQTYFGYDAQNLVNAGLEGVGATAVPTACETQPSFSKNLTDLSYYGATLVYLNKLALRFYFTGSVESVTFSQGTLGAKADKHYVQLDGILPQDLDASVTLTVTDGNGNTQTLIYSPLHYIVRMNAKGDAATQNLMKALYNYHLAAKALTQA